MILYNEATQREQAAVVKVLKVLEELQVTNNPHSKEDHTWGLSCSCINKSQTILIKD